MARISSQEHDTLVLYGRLKKMNANFDDLRLNEVEIKGRLKSPEARAAFDVLGGINTTTDTASIRDVVARRAIGLK